MLNQALSGILGGGPFITLAAMIVHTVTTALVYMLVIERSFSQVTTFPERVLKWMGAGYEIDVDTNNARMGAAAGGVLGKVGSQTAMNGGMAARRALDNWRGRTVGEKGEGSSSSSKGTTGDSNSRAPELPVEDRIGAS